MTNLLKDLSDATTAVAKEAARRVVAVHGRDWGGSSGIIIRPGVIVTAEEALERDDDLEISLPDGTRAKATLAGRDPSTDVAVLRYESAATAPPDATPAMPEAGALILAVGRAGSGSPIVAFGAVAHVGEAWRSSQGGLIDALIRADLSLVRSAEGGALVDAEGKLVGMPVFGPRRRVLAIPLATMTRSAEQILASGTVARGYIGVSVQSVNTGDGRGAIIVGLDPEGPAKQAGVILGDIVLTWNGEPIKGGRSITDRLGPSTVGGTVELGLSRAGQNVQLRLTVAARPSA